MLRRKRASGPSDSLRDRAREKFYDDITSRYPSFINSNAKDKILFLFNDIDPFICGYLLKD